MTRSAPSSIYSRCPHAERRNVARLYDLAKKDVAGFEAYAERMAGLCGSGKANCAMLEDILDGLFHIAKADGLLHEREGRFLHRIAQIFRIEESHYQSILARHAHLGDADPWLILGIERGSPFDEVKKRYRKLVAANHPDKLIARGLPEEFIKIATTRIAAINAAYEMIERGLKVDMSGFSPDHAGAEVRVSPNFGPRVGVSRPDMIILHYTGMADRRGGRSLALRAGIAGFLALSRA